MHRMSCCSCIGSFIADAEDVLSLMQRGRLVVMQTVFVADAERMSCCDADSVCC